MLGLHKVLFIYIFFVSDFFLFVHGFIISSLNSCIFLLILWFYRKSPKDTCNKYNKSSCSSNNNNAPSNTTHGNSPATTTMSSASATNLPSAVVNEELSSSTGDDNKVDQNVSFCHLFCFFMCVLYIFFNGS